MSTFGTFTRTNLQTKTRVKCEWVFVSFVRNGSVRTFVFVDAKTYVCVCAWSIVRIATAVADAYVPFLSHDFFFRANCFGTHFIAAKFHKQTKFSQKYAQRRFMSTSHPKHRKVPHIFPYSYNLCTNNELNTIHLPKQL